MTTAPDQKQGVASAINDATREVGGALGVALAGSILAASYDHHIAAALAAFPGAGSRAGVGFIDQNACGSQSAWPARSYARGKQQGEAFVAATNSSYLVIAIIVAVTAVIIPLWAPGRDGEQLRAVRRVGERQPLGR